MSKAQSLMSCDELSLAREDRVRKEHFFLENKRNSLIKSVREEKQKSVVEVIRNQLLEVENQICYLQRELEIRAKRKEAHEVFLQKKRKNRANGR